MVTVIIKRFVFNKLVNEISEPEINILLRPRQVGKTTLLHQLEKYAKKRNFRTCFYDPRIRNTILKDFSDVCDRNDKGTILESFVFLHLNQWLEPNMEIKFWRTKDGGEVDFILLKNRKPIPIEVKSRLAKVEIPSGLKRFLNRYTKVKCAFVINELFSETVAFQSCSIQFLTFEDFFKGKEIISSL